VAQIPDNGGAQVTSTTNPGGFQLGFGSQYTSGSGGSSKAQKTGSSVQKRNLPNGDVAVLLAKSPSTGNIKGQITTAQDW